MKMIKKIAGTFGLLFFFLLSSGQSRNYEERIGKLYAGIDSRFSDRKTGLYFETTDSTRRENSHSWLWPLCALMQAANESESLQTGKKDLPVVDFAISRYYNPEPPAPAYQDYVTAERKSSRFYDDNQWIAIACLDAWNRLKERKYLDTAEMLCRFMLTGMDTVTGGGLYWKEGDKTSKNTCSNGPAVLILLQLYKINHRQGCLDTALQIYRWTNRRLQAPEGVFYDNIKTATGAVSRATYTYNTGTMLQANVLLYQITRSPGYLQEAQRIAAAGKTLFFRNGRLPSGNYWFNAVFFRGYEALYELDKNKAWLDFVRQDADAIWETERDDQNGLGPKPVKRLIDQAAMIEIYARLARLAREKAIPDAGL